jgi:hypothetical protein
MKFIFTFICSELGTGDMLDPEITVEVSAGRHMYQRALEAALRVFDEEYSDRMEIVSIINGRL